MVKKKKEEGKQTPQKKTSKNNSKEVSINIEKYSLSELLKKHRINVLNTVGFLNYYGLNEDFKLEFETGESKNKFSEGEFEDMYKRYIEREI